MTHTILPSLLAIGIAFQAFSVRAESERTGRSHPPIRIAPAPSQRPIAKGPCWFVDAVKGDDANPGTEQKAWKTIAHGLRQLNAGDTLCLRGGNYFEQICVSLVGKPDAPITIRGFPGETAVLNGGIRDFVESPREAWEPAPGGAAGEFRSARAYPNIRDVVGAFGDSFVGLQTYWHRVDLTATNELCAPVGGQGIAPFYCGPGLWYDADSARIHARLAHTHLHWPGVPNYQGETDPRKLPLVIAPFRSVALHVDGAKHVRFQDLTICGGGYETVVVDQGVDIEFDNVTVRCGTYGLIAHNTVGFRFHHSALYGNIPPWGSRVENGLHTRRGQTGGRDIARLTGHALLVADGHDEFSVYAHPFNRDWEISHSEFTDSHDGLYLAGVENAQFHHNLVDACHDDGIYISPVYPYAPQELRIYQNRFTRCLTAIASGGLHPPRGPVYLYRNLFDLSGPVNYQRPTVSEPTPKPYYGNLFGDHGSPPWPPIYFYQNTCILAGGRHAVLSDLSADRPRRVFNNIFYCFVSLPQFLLKGTKDADLQMDGNLYWLRGADSAQKPGFLDELRKSKPFEESKARYAPGWEARSLVADPKLMKIVVGDPTQNDCRLREGSPAIGKGVTLPAEWQDPLRRTDGNDPDIGAFPFGEEAFQAGRIRKRE